MKKFFFALVAFAAAAMATSCTNEILPEATFGDEAVVSFTVSTPEVATRTYGDGKTACDLYYAIYLWDKDGKTNTGVVKNISKITAADKVAIPLETTVEMKLVNGNTYSILFWAENEAGVAEVNWDEQTMTFNPAKANVEEYDAFWAYVEPFKVTGRIDDEVSLFRPFAQVNVGTADYADAVAAGTTITEAGIEVEVFDTLDFVTGEVKKSATYATSTYAPTALPVGEDFPVAGYKYMTMNYVLVGDTKHLVEVKFNYLANNGDDYQRVYTNVPVRRNYRTNIYGNLLTEEANYTVTIVPGFDEEPGYDVFHEFQYGGTVTLAEDMEVKTPLVVKKGVEATLNLNGKTLKNLVTNLDTDVIIVEEGATLTINGNGTIEAVSGNDGYAVIAEGKVIINGGTFKAGVDAFGKANAVVYARGNGEVYVKGGDFPNENGSGFVLNKKDIDRATTTIEVTGGTFYNFNPADNAAEGTGTNFVAAGYESVATPDGYYTVVLANNDVYRVANATDLQAALDAASQANKDAVINILGDIAGDVKVTEAQDVDIVLNGNGYKYDGQITLVGGSSYQNASFTVDNVNFETSTASRVFIWSDSQKAPERYHDHLTIKNCSFTAVAGSAAEHTAVGYKGRQMLIDVKVNILNCTANNLHSLLQTTSTAATVTVDGVVIEGCKNGMSFGTTKNVVVRNAKVTSTVAGSYGIRVDGVNGYEMSVKNCDLEAYVPVLVRNLTAGNYTANFDGINKFTANGTLPYQVIFSKGDVDDKKAPVAPTGTYTATGLNGFVVFPN
ncbi:MAG: hypothetical protein IKB03_02730 [Tidjanibacter sp.]|nr:hypothetical protein [Tidjanibacter sp.]